MPVALPESSHCQQGCHLGRKRDVDELSVALDLKSDGVTQLLLCQGSAQSVQGRNGCSVQTVDHVSSLQRNLHGSRGDSSEPIKSTSQIARRSCIRTILDAVIEMDCCCYQHVSLAQVDLDRPPGQAVHPAGLRRYCCRQDASSAQADLDRIRGHAANLVG